MPLLLPRMVHIRVTRWYLRTRAGPRFSSFRQRRHGPGSSERPRSTRTRSVSRVTRAPRHASRPAPRTLRHSSTKIVSASLSGVCWRQVRDAWWTSRVETRTSSRHRYCIQTYAKGREFSLVLVFCFPIIYFSPFRMNWFFAIIFFFFFDTVNPRSLPLETIPPRSLSTRTNRSTILARILSNGSVVNVLLFFFLFYSVYLVGRIVLVFLGCFLKNLLFLLTIYKINWLYISVACVIVCRKCSGVCNCTRVSVRACDKRKSVGEPVRGRPVYEKCVSARGCTLDNQGNFGFDRVSGAECSSAVPCLDFRVSVLVCDSVAVNCLLLGENTNFTAALVRRRGFLRLIR